MTNVALQPGRDPFDVLVVGGGLAGWMAATRAHELGQSTALVECSPSLPGWGNTLISGGVLHTVLRDPRTPPAELLATIVDLTDGQTDPVVAAAWADNAAPTIGWMEGHGASFMTDPEQPHRGRVFSPVRPTVPGLHSQGYGAERFLSDLAAAFASSGGAAASSTRAVELQRDGPGWRVLLATEGDRRAVAARKVILCDGGFQANPALLRRYVGTDQVRLRAIGTGCGDGLQMGLEAGGVPFNMSGFYGHLLVREALDDDQLWPYPTLDGLAASGIVVGTNGGRFVDEAQGGVTIANHLAWSDEPLGKWVVVDDAAWEGVGRYGEPAPNPHMLDRRATILTASTLDELARLAHIDPGGLARSVAEVAGDRHGGATPPRSRVARLGTPPFHAIAVVAGVTFTMGGLLVDGAARVLDANREPIPGLYAAGGTMGGLHGGPRAGYAGGLLEAAIFGLLAGTDAGTTAGTAAG